MHTVSPSPSALPHLAVLIATCDRSSDLQEQAFASVVAQTRRPDWIVVVDDSSSQKERELNNRHLQAASGCAANSICLENSRTKGASGAWNTGIDHLTAPRR